VLLPHKRNDHQVLSGVSKLAMCFRDVLKKQIAQVKVFEVEEGTMITQLCDTIRSQYILYQSESIPPEWIVQPDTIAMKDKEIPSKESYWNEVEEEWLGSMRKPDQSVCLDCFCRNVGNIKNDDGTLRYVQLFCLAKCVLSLSHGNAVPERGFSINKHMLQAHGNSLASDTLVALRRVKDAIIRHGGTMHMPISTELLRFVENAYHRYNAEMTARKAAEEEKKKIHTQKEENRKRKAENTDE